MTDMIKILYLSSNHGFDGILNSSLSDEILSVFNNKKVRMLIASMNIITSITMIIALLMANQLLFAKLYVQMWSVSFIISTIRLVYDSNQFSTIKDAAYSLRQTLRRSIYVFGSNKILKECDIGSNYSLIPFEKIPLSRQTCLNNFWSRTDILISIIIFENSLKNEVININFFRK